MARGERLVLLGVNQTTVGVLLRPQVKLEKKKKNLNEYNLYGNDKEGCFRFQTKEERVNASLGK